VIDSLGQVEDLRLERSKMATLGCFWHNNIPKMNRQHLQAEKQYIRLVYM